MAIAPGMPIGGWRVPATCPACGDELLHTTTGVPMSTDARAVAECSGCRREVIVIVRLVVVHEPACARRSRSPVPDDPNKVHGTRQGYNRGCGCQPCVDAQKEYERTRPRKGKVAAA